MSDLTIQQLCWFLSGLYAPAQHLLGAFRSSKEPRATEVMNSYSCGSNGALTSRLFALHFIGLQLH